MSSRSPKRAKEDSAMNSGTNFTIPGRFLGALLGVLTMASWTSACKQKAEVDPCDSVSCCGQGECSLVGDEARCTCKPGFTVSADGIRCLADDAGACTGKTCSDHGCCVLEEDEARCECDPGYRVDPNDPLSLSCIEKRCLNMGEKCTDSSECCDNDCLKYTGQAEGYCTRRDCHSSEECNNYSADGKEMCCVDVGGEYFICMKLGSGCFCGDQTGTCGHSCTCQNDSACAPDYSCLRGSDEDTGAVCTKPCNTDSDCRECKDDRDPNIIFTCQPIFGGDTYCLAAEQPTCDWGGDCTGSDVCVAFPTADDKALEGRCNNLGGLPPGEECDDMADPNLLPFEDRCADFYCMRGFCSEVCQFDTDCPEHMFCGEVRFRMGDGEDTAAINMCQGGTFCDSGADCEGDDVCQVAQISAYDLVGMCGQFDGLLEVGEECNEDVSPNDLPPAERCKGFYCIFGNCTEVCQENEDCVNGGRCCSVTFGGMGPTGNDTASIGLCRWTPGSGTACRGNNDCPEHETCQYCVKENETVDKFCVTENCDVAHPNCSPPGTADCSESSNPCWGGLCLVSMSNSFCSALCETAADCPSGMDCGGMYVTNTQVTGVCVPQ
jgi:hypothetical protein